MSRVIDEYKTRDIEARFKHIPAHVGIYGNECADKLAKAAVARAHRSADLSPSQLLDRQIENHAQAVFNDILANM